MALIKSLRYIIRSTKPDTMLRAYQDHEEKLTQAISNVRVFMQDEGEFLNLYGVDAGMGGYTSPILKGAAKRRK